MAWRRSVAGTSPGIGRTARAGVLGLSLALTAAACAGGERDIGTGPWRAWLSSPGGELPFGLTITPGPGEPDGGGRVGYEATITNGEEVIRIPEVVLEGRSLRLGFPHYASVITATLSRDGAALEGEWIRRSGPDKSTRMAFHATHGESPRFALAEAAGEEDASGGIDGQWRVRFLSEEDDSIGIFQSGEDGDVTGTFLVTTGDYRYLGGEWGGGRLLLSTFDGAHAFLFEARMLEDGTLKGDFWSRDTWHDTWTARRDDEAVLADGFELSQWKEDVVLESTSFPDMEGRQRSLADPAFAGRARIIEIFGTWCPNCNDAAPLLREYQNRYGPRGLSILALAFEMTGDFDKDVEQVRRYRERYGVTYPVLLAGTAPKAESSRSLPLLDRVRAYPTFIFVDGSGRIAAVYSGFSGPATGKAHARLREGFEGMIERLLSEGPGEAKLPGPAAAGPGSAETGS